MARFFSYPLIAAAAMLSAAPAHAELVNASSPSTIKAMIESRGWPAKLVTKDSGNPYISSEIKGMKFAILFMNCSNGRNCKTLQYYIGFGGSKDVSLSRINKWNKEKRFARAYIDNDGDPVLEMDVDLDFNGIPRENLGETLNTWASLVDSYSDFIAEE